MMIWGFISSGLFLGWKLGANGAANVFGSAVGSRMIKFRTAAIIATIFIIKAVYPFLNSGNSSIDKYHSYIFFNSVAEFKTEKDYTDSYSKQSDIEVENDLTRQAYQLAKGLKSKFYHIEWAMRFIYAELFILLLILLTLIIF